MADSSSVELLEEINSKAQRMLLWPLVTAFSAIVFLIMVAAEAPTWTFVAAVPLCAGAVYAAILRDHLKKTVVLFYQMEPHLEEAYQALHNAFDVLQSCARTWHVEARGEISGLYEWKTSGGAYGVVQRKPVQLSKGSPPYFKTNIIVPKLPAGRKTLYFFPDRLLVYSSDGVGALAYDKLEIRCEESRFIESEWVPSDAKTVDSTWQYVNKSGGPDRRFANNRQIPIVLYGVIELSSSPGLREVFQASRGDSGPAFKKAVAGLTETLASKAVGAAPDYVTCPCNNCNGHIEFPESGVGQTVPCPHCGLDTTLFKPVAASIALTPRQRSTLQPDSAARPENEAQPEPEVHISSLPPDPASPSKSRQPPKPKPITVAATPMIGNYQLPPLDFLQHPDPTLKPTESKEELLANARLMQQTLAQFEIPVELGDITKGPTITRYELYPAPGVKLEKITALNNNLAAALKAERIHILAPVPGKSSVGVEVPNPVKTSVIIRDLLESEEWRNTQARIPLALGKDVYGHPIIADLSEMPHLLIAGSTGSGKSVFINAIITALLYRFSPDQLRFVMIDPRVVELQQYNTLPHLVVPVVTDPKKVILALRWVVNEMEKRYQIFARVGVRNIGSFNSRPKNKPLPPREPELPLLAKKEKVEPGADGFAVEVDEEIVVPREEDIIIPEKLSYIVVIIDELADLMLVAPADVEMAIARITQMAHPAGIHCIVATQRPSVDVITGVIKANIPARIAFQVAAKVDSRTILDAMGADKLLGKGDMLYLPPGSAKLIRAQGALITDQEIQSIVDFIAKQAMPSYELEIHQQLSRTTNGSDDESGIDEDEEIIQDCIEVIRSEQKASVSLLQRRLRLGYGRAARIMDELENRGIVGPSNGAEPRDILIDLDGGGADGRGQ
jgi:S-DNA-T family DNA segregation ATPase FtsK/SpoIIIE